MAERKYYHVTIDKGRWVGMAENAKRVSVTGETKEDVLDPTLEIAKHQAPSAVIIHRQDGSVQDKRMYNG